MRRALVLALALSSAACASPAATEIVVVADTDLAVPAQIDALRIVVTHEDGREQEGVADLGGGAPRPVTLGLVSRTGDGRLEVVVIGERDGVEIVRRTARVAFERDHTLALRMDLWARCVGVLCGADRACGDDGCRPMEVARAELVAWTGTPPGAPDAARTPDAGPVPGDASHPIDAHRTIDAGSDAFVHVPDAWMGTDAFTPTEDGYVLPDAWSVPDVWIAPDAWVAECTSDAECDDGWSCTEDTCALGRCSREPRDAACDDGIACTTERCDATLGCVYDPRDAACEDGIPCTTHVCDRLVGCRTTPVHASCTAGSYCDTTTGCTVASTFAEIYGSIISVRCTPCHVTAVPRSGTLDMGSQETAHASLVGTVARCGAGVNTRVLPGDSSHSLLWRKVAGVDLCGVRMPRMLTPLDDAQIAQIAHWIDSGALP